MALVSVKRAKEYLRVDSADDDMLIESFLAAAENLCRDVARVTDEEWAALDVEVDEGGVPVEQSEDAPVEITPEQARMKEMLVIAILYTVGYLYEHREEADHHDLTLSLRGLLFGIREGDI